MKIFNFRAAVLLFVIVFLFPNGLRAQTNPAGCSDRYVTLVNPVRSRDLWHDKSINPLVNQYGLINKHNLPATWLLQYDVLADLELFHNIKNFDKNQELGLFLEVSPQLAKEARVIYPHAVSWFNPRAVFLSGYSQSERRKLIDKLFTDFKSNFGYYPKSVGAWWIDSYSLNYMKEKYRIKAALIVADQKTTDNYGVWGQWWGVPYYPSKANILTPASYLSNKQDVLIIQWAQRDPLFSYGDGPQFSNYSLQANDYTERGKDTLYFNQLVNIYLNCKNPIGQVTIGLETGIESIGYINEYENQLISLRKNSYLQFVTMSQMAQRFAKVYPDFSLTSEVSLGDSFWKMTTEKRINERLNDRINYSPGISFSDYFVADPADFLDRKLPNVSIQKNSQSLQLFLLVGLALGIISFFNKKFIICVLSMLFALAAFGLIFRSFYQFGWQVYYGPVIHQLEFAQVGLVLIIFLVFLVIHRRFKNIYLLPLVFGLDSVIASLRFSVISNNLYFGTIIDTFKFLGFSISSSNVKFLYLDLPSYQAAALLKLNFDKVWDNLYLALIAYPLIHLFLGIVLIYLLPKLPYKIRIFVVIVLAALFGWYLSSIFNADPRQVVPIL